MNYHQVVAGKFLARPNRFIAHVELAGQTVVCHVKNTGRCRELLQPGAKVYLAVAENPNRKTAYDLIAVEKGDLLVNMDAQAPNAAAAEYLPRLFPEATKICPEKVFGQSRFDFYLEAPGRKIFLEVKGVTLEQDGVASFPDAPTERGVKHLQELTRCLQAGYEAYVLFVIQMRPVCYFRPNDEMHPAFGAALRQAVAAGVKALAVDCLVTPETMTVAEPVEIQL